MQRDRQEERGGLTLLQLILIVAAITGGGLYLYHTLSPAAATTAVIEQGTIGAHYSGTALIVRDEIAYDAEGVTSIEYLATEGATINRNMPICNVFSSGFSTKELTSLQDYRDQIRDYQISLIAAETTYDASLTRIESDVMSRAKEVREILAGTRGSLGNQERLLDTAITARQNYLKRKYAADQRLSRLYDDEQAQQQRIDSWTKQYVSARDGIISFYTDGYELSLTSSNYDTFTPGEVRRMINGAMPATATSAKGRTTIYRTVQSDTWYLLMLVDNSDWTPVEGETYQLQLEQNSDKVMGAVVESVVRAGGELLVRLRATGNIKTVLYMRTCRVELGDYMPTLKVPARAIYRYNEMDGVVLLTGGQQVFIPVNVVLREGDAVYVSAVTEGLLYAGQTVQLF